MSAQLAPVPLVPLARVDQVLDADRARIWELFTNRRSAGERGAVVIRFDEPAGAPLAWLPYSAAALRALGVHFNSSLGRIMREDRRRTSGRSLQSFVFVDRGGRMVHVARVWVDAADGAT